MTWLEFAASIIDNVFSWPVAALLIVLILRRQLADLFRTVESFVLEAGGTRVSFNRGLERAREGLAEAAKKPLPAGHDGAQRGQLEDAETADNAYLSDQYSYISGLAQSNPSYAIETAWEQLIADQANRLAYEKGLPPSGETLYQLAKLNERGIVDSAVADSVRNMANIRSRVAVTMVEPSTVQALEYVQVARDVADYLNSLRKDATRQPPTGGFTPPSM